MKKYFAILLALAILLTAGRAQNPTTFTIIATGTLASCAPVVANQTQYCFPVDGLAVSVKGAPYVLVPLAAPAAAVTKVNGVAPGATGNVTVTCNDNAPAVTVTPPASISSTTTLNNLSTPGVSVAAPATTCTGAGS